MACTTLTLSLYGVLNRQLFTPTNSWMKQSDTQSSFSTFYPDYCSSLFTNLNANSLPSPRPDKKRLPNVPRAWLQVKGNCAFALGWGRGSQFLSVFKKKSRFTFQHIVLLTAIISPDNKKIFLKCKWWRTTFFFFFSKLAYIPKSRLQQTNRKDSPKSFFPAHSPRLKRGSSAWPVPQPGL